MNHSHPKNTEQPFGLKPYRGIPARKWGDIGFSSSVTEYLLKDNKHCPTFNIFIPKKQYINYRPTLNDQRL